MSKRAGVLVSLLCLVLVAMSLLLSSCGPSRPDLTPTPILPTPTPTPFLVRQGLPVDVLSDCLDVHLAPAGHRLEVSATVGLELQPGTREVVFLLDPRLQVDAARWDGQPATPVARGSYVTVTVPAGGAIAGQADVTLHYAGEIAGPPPGSDDWPGPGHVLQGSVVLGWVIWYPMVAPGEDFYSATLTVWVPQGLMVVATGSPAGQEESPGEVGYRPYPYGHLKVVGMRSRGRTWGGSLCNGWRRRARWTMLSTRFRSGKGR